MVVFYIVDDGLVEPSQSKQKLHEYHADISAHVDAEVVGCTGHDGAIRRIVLSQDTDISALENWLDTDIRREDTDQL